MLPLCQKITESLSASPLRASSQGHGHSDSTRRRRRRFGRAVSNACLALLKPRVYSDEKLAISQCFQCFGILWHERLFREIWATPSCKRPQIADDEVYHHRLVGHRMLSSFMDSIAFGGLQYALVYAVSNAIEEGRDCFQIG